MSDGPDQSQRLIAGLRTGDAAIEHEFWEQYGADGFRALGELRQAIPADIPVILDGKRGLHQPQASRGIPLARFDELPYQRRRYVGDRLHKGPCRTPDDDHRQLAFTGGVEFGDGQLAAAVLGHDHVDPVVVDQAQLSGNGVRTAIEDQLVSARERRLRRVDAADQTPDVVETGEGRETLSARRQEHARAKPADRGSGAGEVVDPGPAVAPPLAPARSFQAKQRHAGSGARARCGGHYGNGKGEEVATHIFRYWRSGIKTYSCCAPSTGSTGLIAAGESGPRNSMTVCALSM